MLEIIQKHIDEEDVNKLGAIIAKALTGHLRINKELFHYMVEYRLMCSKAHGSEKL